MNKIRIVVAKNPSKAYKRKKVTKGAFGNKNKKKPNKT